ncbi:rRNA maturation RNase YbeY [Halalkalibacillus halophilus]|uniref:rRNA maturation RNase YbeY n=1 Tax=Halalkalibacillus halophilus TaxID=392827 RepID=UPI003CCBA892
MDEYDHLSIEHKDLLQNVLSFAAKEEKIEDHAELSLTIVSNEDIQQINKQYRGKDHATDVISFALEESGEDELDIIGDDLPLILGDIIISIDQAKLQAIEYQHSIERELGFLAVHGLLHLIGYDHQTKEEETAMFHRQDQILEAYGLNRNAT